MSDRCYRLSYSKNKPITTCSHYQISNLISCRIVMTFGSHLFGIHGLTPETSKRLKNFVEVKEWSNGLIILKPRSLQILIIITRPSNLALDLGWPSRHLGTSALIKWSLQLLRPSPLNITPGTIPFSSYLWYFLVRFLHNWNSIVVMFFYFF